VVPKAGKAGGAKRASLTGSNPLDAVGTKVKQMLETLPVSLPLMERSTESLKDPLWRCYDREMGVGKSLLEKVRADLDMLKGACEGSVKATNEIRALILDLNIDAVPKHWKKYAVADITVTEWLADFVLRLKQLQQLQCASSLQQHTLWMGGLFFPEAFLTASRQAVAQMKQVSLEELLLVVEVGSSEQDSESFAIKGLQMEGAAWDMSGSAGQLKMTEKLTVALPQTCLKWVKGDSGEYKRTLDFLPVPVYLNTSRSSLVSEFNLQTPKDVPPAVWQQRSVCLTLWTKS